MRLPRRPLWGGLLAMTVSLSMSTKLNILTTCLRYPPAPGGAEVLIEQLSQGLASRGHNLKVYTSDLLRHNLPAE
ncbi:MAG: hypothetical protein Q8N68_01725, partial [bacterium]|nr:hypothetical protein [bacterium]